MIDTTTSTSFCRSGPGSQARWIATRALGQAAAVASLYKAAHPVTAKAVEEAKAAVERAVLDGNALTIGWSASGWLIDGAPAPRAVGIPDALSSLAKDRGCRSIGFWPGVSSPELAALCELAASPPDGDAAAAVAFLKSRGVRHITLGTERADAAPPPPPLPPPPAPLAARPPFNTFLQALVQRSVADPVEQARLYAEALQLLRDGMREALEGQIAAAQEKLDAHAQRLVTECERTQRVLASVAEGRVTVDPDGRVLMMNAAAEQIAGKPLRELTGRPLADGVSGDSQMLSMTLTGETGKPRFVVSSATETYDLFRKSVALVCDPEGKVLGTLGVLPHAAKAQETSRLQEDFVSRVTHELKAPLTSIAAALELLDSRAGGTLADTERALLETSTRNAERLRRLIDDLLDFASLQQGTLELRPAPCAPQPIVEESVRGLAPWAESKKVRLSIAPPSGPLEDVLADGARIVQVLTNLLSNALKATPAGGSVDAGVVAEGSACRFWVRDTGCGIAKDDQARIFDKFVQVQEGTGRREGVGLGLAIVADIVRRHGGAIEVDSEPGRGAIFSFTVPAA